MRRALVAVALSAAFAACAPVNERGATGRGAQRATHAAGTMEAGSDTASTQPPTTPAVLAVVLPKKDGNSGSIVVRNGDQQIVIEETYGAARIHANGEIVRLALQPAEVQRQFSGALSALPERPATFLVYFDGNSDRLTADSVAQLQQILNAIKRYASAEISATGHTDSVGAAQHNDALSLSRARRVRDELVSRGVPPARFTSVAGRGERELLIATGDNVPEPRNRRVEIGVR
jgi:outer membrane protein OmpA-like peptidoglycan-associated protein